MTPSVLLEWQNLIFLLPLGASALLLALSALGVGGDAEGSEAGDGDTGRDGPDEIGGDNDPETDRATDTLATGPIHKKHGFGIMGVQFALLAWGVGGFWAYQAFSMGSWASFALLLSLLAATLCALMGLWAGHQVAARFVIADAGAVGRNELYGLTGRVLFPVTEKSGRVRIYDARGAIHDESCRAAKGTRPLTKGERARVVDISPDGCLVVEPEQIGV